MLIIYHDLLLHIDPLAKVTLETFEDKAEQLWEKGEPDAEGYFTLKNSGIPKAIAAISESRLESKGNMTLR